MVVDLTLDPFRPKCGELPRGVGGQDKQRVGCPPPGDERDAPVEGYPVAQAFGSKVSDTPFMQ